MLVLVGCIGLKFENTEENPVEGDLFGTESGAVVGSKFTVFVDGWRKLDAWELKDPKDGKGWLVLDRW